MPRAPPANAGPLDTRRAEGEAHDGPPTEHEGRTMPLILAALALAGTASAPPADDDAPPAPMDLVWETTDVNGVAANPKWGLQVTEPGSLPDVAETCFTVPGWFDNPLCSTQHPASDTAVGIR